MVQSSWINHIDIIAPAMLQAFELLIWIISGLGTALIAVLLWIGRGVGHRFNRMETKIDLIHHAMLHCDGCAESLEKIGYGRRNTDLDDNEGSFV